MEYKLLNYCEIDKYAAKAYAAVHKELEEKNLGDITNVDISKLPKDFTLLTHGSPCFVAGTLVCTDRGYFEIEHIQKNDMVLTHDGTFKKVLDVGSDGVKPIHRLSADSILPIYCTENHPFYSLTVQDLENKKLPKKVRYSDLTEDHLIGVPIVKEECNDYNLSYDDCYNLGVLYAGYTIEKYSDNLLDFIRECGVLDADCSFFDFTYDIVKLPINLIKAFLAGYHHNISMMCKDVVPFISHSDRIINGLVLCLQKVFNLGCKVTKVGENYSVETQYGNWKSYYKTDGYIWYPISKLDCEREEVIFNIEVEDNHTYLANNCMVYNCTSFSNAGYQLGGDRGSGTASSLMWNSVEIIKHSRPKVVIWENVSNVLSKKHKHNFDEYIDTLDTLGYNSYYQVLDSKNYNVPQHRSRIFIVSILKGIDKGYMFPAEKVLEVTLKDILESDVEPKFILSEEQINRIKTTTYCCGARRIQRKDWCDTVCARDWKDPKCVEVEGVTRKLTPREYWRIQGFSDEDFDSAKAVGMSNTQLYKQAGNSISYGVIKDIFESLFEMYPELKEDMTMISLFSGIGAFEMALRDIIVS